VRGDFLCLLLDRGQLVLDAKDRGRTVECVQGSLRGGSLLRIAIHARVPFFQILQRASLLLQCISCGPEPFHRIGADLHSCSHVFYDRFLNFCRPG
jgi:hypothetical protein